MIHGNQYQIPWSIPNLFMYVDTIGFMWSELERIFENKPSQRKVLEMLLEFGFSVKKEGDKIKIFAAEIQIPISKVAKAVGVDRKVVDETILTIAKEELLYSVFSKLRPVADISYVARYAKNSKKEKVLRNYQGVLEIKAFSESIGIAALVTNLLAENNLSIQFMLAKDPQLSVESTLIVVTDKSIPGRVTERLLRNKNIIEVSLS